MSGPGDIDGEVSGDEAAWRDLIAHFDDPASPETSEAPWPASENLTESARGSEAGTGLPDSTGGAAPGAPPAPAPPAPAPPAAGTTAPPAAPDAAGGGRAGQAPAADSASGHREPPRESAGIFIPIDRTRVIRQAGDPRSYSPPDEEDERYVPVPLPPPRKLDPVSKGAWVAVIGGPAYLVIVGLFLHWSISATAAFFAIAAFVGGFVTLVVKLGDHPRRDDDDDGAVL
jgi:hypothetical protein